MAHQVHWTERIVSEFCAKAMLSEDEVFILVTRVKGWTVTRQSLEMHCSEQRIHRMISLLKKKYDVVQAEFPDVFPVRRTSSKETYMDEH